MLTPDISAELIEPIDLNKILSGKFATTAHINLLKLQSDCEDGKKGELRCCLTLMSENNQPVSIIYTPERMSALGMACVTKAEQAIRENNELNP